TSLPVSMMSSARPRPTSRGSRCVPPAPGMRPSLSSGRPRRADEPATRNEHAIANSSPPPRASPSTAATDTAGWAARRSTAARRASPYAPNDAASTDDMCLMSAPAAKKPGRAEDTTMTLAGNASAASSPMCSPSMIGSPNALAGGRLSMISTTEPATRRLTGEPLSDSIVDVPPWFLRNVRRSRHGQATADRQRLTGDVFGGIRCEEGDRGCDVGRLGQPFHRNGAGHPADHLVGVLPGAVGELAQRRRVGGARADSVHRHAVGRHFAGQRLGERDNASLGPGIDRFQRGADATGIRTDVDHPPESTLHHAGDDDVADAQRTLEVDVKDLVPEVL